MIDTSVIKILPSWYTYFSVDRAVHYVLGKKVEQAVVTCFNIGIDELYTPYVARFTVVLIQTLSTKKRELKSLKPKQKVYR